MNAIRVFTFVFFISITRLFAANSDKIRSKEEFMRSYEQAEALLKNQDFSGALYIYLDLYEFDRGNFNLHYKIGYCYLKDHTTIDKAVFFLEKASMFISPDYEDSYEEKKAPLITIKLLGNAYHKKEKFDLAISAYKKFKKRSISSGSKDSGILRETDREIEMCHIAKKLVAAPLNVKIQNMGKRVNSPYPDYAPVFTADQSTMIFTSGRPGNVGGKTYNGGKYFEDIYISTKTDSGWGEAKNIGPPINTVGNEASVGISADGQEILIYKDDYGDGNIYSTSLKGSNWTVPKKLNAHINSKSWEPSAFITPNGNTLYFVSDRPGGMGGRDIYKSEKNARGEWGKAINLGSPINSQFDEDAPYLHPDGITLYFSSNGHKTMGGFDIFQSKLVNNTTWSDPVNVGYPINSTGDDVFYVVSPDKKTAYYTSMRDGGYGEKDNYIITFPEPEESPLTLQKGAVLDTNNIAAKDVKITVTDNESQEVLGEYHPNEKTGKYLFILKPGKNHNIYYEAAGYLFYSQNVTTPNDSDYNEIIKSVKLEPIAVGSKVVLNNLFFDFDKAELRRSSSTELSRLYDFLVKHPELTIEISGYTDSKGTDNYNANLSVERALAVINYLVDKGIKKERLVAVGHGKENPIAPNRNADGTDNPEGRQMNRRVELKIIDIKTK
ncbi:MAG: OmpA family protein [Bacteroidia bacterium]